MENFVLRERLVGKNGWQHYVYQADECTLHGANVRPTGIENNDFATTTTDNTDVQVAVNTRKGT